MTKIYLYIFVILLIYGIGPPAKADADGKLIIDFTQFKHQLNTTNQSESPYSYGVSTAVNAKPREFSSMNIQVVRAESKSNSETTYWASNITKLDNITLNLDPGIYKIITQLEGDSTVLEYNNDSSGYEVSPKSCLTVPMYYPPNPTGYIFDVPWRIEKSEQFIPILAANPRYPMNIRNIIIYDNNNNEIVRNPLSPPQNPPFFYLFKIDKNSFVESNGKISIKMKFDLEWFPDITEGPLRTAISQEDLPMISNWYCGDTHIHSNYTINALEIGYPIDATQAANKALGLDWVATTDHSFDLDQSKWQEQTADCEVHSNDLLRVLQGEEVSCYLPGTGYLSGKLPFYNHLLVYGTNFIYGGEWEDGNDSGHTPEEVINFVSTQNGVIYIAHPFKNDPFRDPFEDYSLNFQGLQIWNYFDEVNDEPSLEKGLSKWVDLLLDGRHIFIEGGTDAHGDFNKYAGKVKTYIYAPGYSQTSLPPCEEILNALRYGHSVMTDGPLVVFNITNEQNETEIIGNEIIGNNFIINIQWKSTNEFGVIDHIHVYQGIIGRSAEVEICDLTPLSLTGSTVYVPSEIPEANATYFRLAATTNKGFAVYTNPIWIGVPPQRNNNIRRFIYDPYLGLWSP